MVKTVVEIEDNDKGELEVKWTSSSPLPDKYEDYTLSQILVSQLYEIINKLLEEPKE